MIHHKFGSASQAKLETCHPEIQLVMHRAIKVCPFDITIVWGWRGEEAQTTAFRLGNSKTPWPESKHNNLLEGQPYSLAIDAAPWIDGRIPWDDQRAFSVLAGVILSTNLDMNRQRPHDIEMRWGGDWDRDGNTLDQTFMDLAHFEVLE